MAPEDSIDDVDAEAIGTFLRKPGSIELLIVVSAGGATYTEIVEKTKIVDSTVNKRRAEALERGLITGDSDTEGDEINRYYALTPLGMAICQRIYAMGLGAVFWKLQGLREQYDEMSSDLLEWVEENETLGEQAEQMRKWEEQEGSPFEDRFPE